MKKIFAVIFSFVMVLCLIGCSKHQEPTDFESLLAYQYNIKVEAFKKQNKNCQKGQIVFIGDSLTEMYDFDEFFNFSEKQIYNRGISGDTTNGVLNRLKTSVFNIKPSKVFLMIGVNDVYHQKTNDEILSNYAKIIDKIKKKLPKCQVYVLSILPFCANYQNMNTSLMNEQIINLNNQICDLAKNRGYQFVDLFCKLADSENYLNVSFSCDGLHLNEEGYKIVTQELKQYIIL